MANMDFLRKRIEELSLEEQERFWIDWGKKLAELPEHAQNRIELMTIGEIEDEIIKHHESFGKMQGMSSGYRKIDDLTRGFVPGEMTIVAGATSNGKTAISINMAVRMAAAGHTVLFVTLEMTKVELGSRIYHIYKKPLTGLPILFQKNDELDWRDVDGLIEKAIAEGAEIVFIDHLHYFTRDVDHVNEALARISKEIKKNAIRHNIPVVLLAQTRKGTGIKKEIGNDEVMGSGAITQDADAVLFVRRDKEEPNYITIQITKNRNRGYQNDIVVLNFNETIITDPEFDFTDPFPVAQLPVAPVTIESLKANMKDNVPKNFYETEKD